MDFLFVVIFTLGLTFCLFEHTSTTDNETQSSFYYTSPSRVTIAESQNLRLKCTPRNANNSITWSKIALNAEDILLQKSSEKFHLEFLGNILVVKDVNLDDSGRYRCTIIEEGTTVEFAEMAVIVHSLPHWRHEPHDLLLQPGDSAEIECDAVGNPTPSVTWQINGHSITFDEQGLVASVSGLETAENKLYLNGTSLSIMNLQPQDAAVIRCYARNLYGSLIADVYLDILDLEPRFLLPPSNATQVGAGKRTTIKCKAIGSPKPVISWYFNYKQINVSNSASHSRFRIADDGSLTILKAKLSHAGNIYECKAKNKFGEITASGELQVKIRTRVHCNIARQIEEKRKHMVLRCSVLVDPSLDVKITWKKDGTRLDPGCSVEDRIFQPRDLGMHNSILIFRSLIREDSGTYTITAKTSLDEDSGRTVLVVQDVPDRPEPVEVTYHTDTSVFVSWQPSNDHNSATEVFLLYANSSWDGGLWKIMKMLPSEYTNANVDLQPWTSYNFAVQQVNSVGYSELSHPSPTYKTPASKPDFNPSNVRAEILNNSHIRITWKPLKPRKFNGPGLHYLLSWRRRSDFEEAWNTKGINNPAINSTVIDIEEEEYGLYEIRARALNDVGMAPPPLTISVLYNASTETNSSNTQSRFLEPLTAPEDCQAFAISATEITVKWRSLGQSVVDALQGYRICYWIEGSSQFKQVSATPSATTMTLTGLTPATEYVIYMYGFGDAGDGPKTGNLLVQTREDVPGPVADFEAQVDETNLHIRWDEPEETNGILLGYRVTITQYEGLEMVENAIFISDPNETQYTATDLLPATTYRVEVQALTSAGFGPVTYWEVRTQVNESSV